MLLDLANALGGQMNLVAYGLQRLRGAIEAVARAQHRSFPIVKTIRRVPQSVGVELPLDGVIAILGLRIGKHIRERASGAVFALELLLERARAELDAHETVELIVGIAGALDKLVTGGLAVKRQLMIVPRVLDGSELTHRPVGHHHRQCEARPRGAASCVAPTTTHTPRMAPRERGRSDRAP